MLAETLLSLMRAGKGLDPLRLFAISLPILFLVKSGIHCARPVVQRCNCDYYAVTSRI
jgi:hypothetical protein